MLAVFFIGWTGVFPVGTAGVVVGIVAFFEAFFAELEEVEAVGFVFGALWLGQCNRFFAVAGEDGVFAFDVDVEDTVEIGAVLLVVSSIGRS